MLSRADEVGSGQGSIKGAYHLLSVNQQTSFAASTASNRLEEARFKRTATRKRILKLVDLKADFD